MNKTRIQSNFSRAAQSYKQHAKVQYEIGLRLSQRFDYYKLTPKIILDLGAGPGPFSHELKKRFKSAQVISLDLSETMLNSIKNSWRYPLTKVASCMAQLPFKNDSFDIIFSNQVIHWATDFTQLFIEINRVLKADGVFVFSTLGPDTFSELSFSWAQVDKYSHVKQFADMHVLGDCLLKAGFAEPVVDMEYLTARYQDVKTLARDLKAQGVQHHASDNYNGLMTPAKWLKFTKAYETLRDEDQLLPLTYEVIYGQACGKVKIAEINGSNEVVVPLSQLRKKNN